MGFRDFVRLARELIAAGGPELIPTTLLRQAGDLAAKAEKLLATSRPLFGKNGFNGHAEQAPATPEQVQQKIETIYGVSRTSDGVLFVTQAQNAARVSLAGDFNNWSPESTPMIPNGDGSCFRAMLPLAPGRYRYRYVIDGQWARDSYNHMVESNPFGDVDSVVEVAE